MLGTIIVQFTTQKTAVKMYQNLLDIAHQSALALHLLHRLHNHWQQLSNILSKTLILAHRTLKLRNLIKYGNGVEHDGT